MVRFTNKLTGSLMWVADDRAEEYIRAGHLPLEHRKPEELGDAACEEKKAKPRTKKTGKE